MDNILTKNEVIIILWLLHNEQGNLRELMRSTNLTQMAIYNNTRWLEERRFITESRGKNRAKIFKITDKGRAYAIDYQKLIDTHF